MTDKDKARKKLLDESMEQASIFLEQTRLIGRKSLEARLDGARFMPHASLLAFSDLEADAVVRLALYGLRHLIRTGKLYEV